MKTYYVSWLNKCDCGANHVKVYSASKDKYYFFLGDICECPICGETGEIEIIGEDAEVSWDKDGLF